MTRTDDAVCKQVGKVTVVTSGNMHDGGPDHLTLDPRHFLHPLGRQMQGYVEKGIQTPMVRRGNTVHCL